MTVTVRYFDPATGLGWRNGFDEDAARRHLRLIAAGRMKDPTGEPWPLVRAWIERAP
jgi:hypothetical protein